MAKGKNVWKRVNVLEIKYLRTVCGVRRIDQVSNDRARERYGNKSTVEKAQEVL